MGVPAIICKIIVIVTAIAIIILTIPYWIHLKYSVDNNDILWIILDILSAVFMIILGIIGIVGALKPGRMLLLIYAIGMICLFIFILIQLIVNALVYQQCDDTTLYLFTCNYNLASYIVPTVIMLVITICGGVFGILLRKEIADDSKPAGSYY